MGHRRGGGEADGLADLAHRGRVAAPVDGVADDLQHAALALGEPVAVGAAVGEGAHRRRAARRCPVRPSRCACAGRPTSRWSPPRLLLAGCRCSRAGVRRENRSAERPPFQTGVRRFSPRRVASVGGRPVDIAQTFDSNSRSKGVASVSRSGGVVMGSVAQAVVEFDEAVQAPWRPPLAGATGRRGQLRAVPGPGTDARTAVVPDRPGGRRGGPRPPLPGTADAPARARRSGSAPAACRAGLPTCGRRPRSGSPGAPGGSAWCSAWPWGWSLGSWVGSVVAGDGERSAARGGEQRRRAAGRHAVVDRGLGLRRAGTTCERSSPTSAS